MHRFQLADRLVGLAVGYDKYGLCLVVQFRTDMTSGVVIPLVQMQDTMNVKVLTARP